MQHAHRSASELMSQHQEKRVNARKGGKDWWRAGGGECGGGRERETDGGRLRQQQGLF